MKFWVVQELDGDLLKICKTEQDVWQYLEQYAREWDDMYAADSEDIPPLSTRFPPEPNETLEEFASERIGVYVDQVEVFGTI